MPYIKQERRDELDPYIEDLIEELTINIAPGIFVVNEGDLNYTISKICKNFFEINKTYSIANELIGVLECVKLEMYRTQIVNYEEEKRKINGNI